MTFEFKQKTNSTEEPTEQLLRTIVGVLVSPPLNIPERNPSWRRGTQRITSDSFCTSQGKEAKTSFLACGFVIRAAHRHERRGEERLLLLRGDDGAVAGRGGPWRSSTLHMTTLA